jgi:hypothetical protein
MPTYRTYIIGRADHFWGADFECADDQEAVFLPHSAGIANSGNASVS